MSVVRIPASLRGETGGRRSVDVDAATVREALVELTVAYPELDGRLLDGDEPPRFLNLFVDGTDVRALAGLETPLEPGSTLLLLPAMAGG